MRKSLANGCNSLNPWGRCFFQNVSPFTGQSWESGKGKRSYGCLFNLQTISYQYPSLRAQGVIAALILNASAQLDDISIDLRIRSHLHPQPLQANRLVGVN